MLDCSCFCTSLNNKLNYFSAVFLYEVESRNDIFTLKSNGFSTNLF